MLNVFSRKKNVLFFILFFFLAYLSEPVTLIIFNILLLFAHLYYYLCYSTIVLFQLFFFRQPSDGWCYKRAFFLPSFILHQCAKTEKRKKYRMHTLESHIVLAFRFDPLKEKNADSLSFFSLFHLFFVSIILVAGANGDEN